MAVSTIQNPALQLNPVNFDLVARTNVSVSSQANFRMGKLGFLIFRFKSDTALGSGSVIATIPSGLRPNKDYASYAIYPTGSKALSIAAGANGNVVIGSGYEKGLEYRAAFPYIIA